MSSNDKEKFNIVDFGTALNAEGGDDILNALKSKFMDIYATKHMVLLGSLAPVVKQRVDVLKQIQAQRDELEAKFFEERAALEAKYQNLYQSLYNKRFEIVSGVNEEQENTPDAKEKGVPDFWLIAMKNNNVLAEEISERDEEALKFLKDIKWSRVDNPKGFKLEFHFGSNPFFTNVVLTKTYQMIDEEVEPILEKAIGTEVAWFPGKCLTEKNVKKKSKKGSKKEKPTTEIVKCDSFFNFFSPPQVPEEGDEIEEDDAEELNYLLEQDFDIGTTIRDKLIPNAVSWFTGDAADDKYDLMIADDDENPDDEDEDEEDDDYGDEEDEEEDESKTRKKD